jgi:Tfp pilus assembly protein PilO
MTGRDRMVLIGVLVVVALGAAWMLAVSPERKQAATLGTEVAAAKTQLASAEGQLANARAAQSQYAASYSSVVSLGKAVPPTQEVPALIDQIAHATHDKNVDFTSITSGGSGTTSAASSASSSFAQLPFTFTFVGSYFDLEHLFGQLTDFATPTPSGALQVNGRLLTVQSVRLAPSTTSSSKPGESLDSHLTATIGATAYMLPASQGLTAGATATSPTGATTPAAGTGSASPSTPAAIVKVTP